MWWYMPVSSALRKLRREVHHKVETNLGYIVSSRAAQVTEQGSVSRNKKEKTKTKNKVLMMKS